MWNPASPTRRALALLMAAAVAVLGSTMLLEMGRTLPQLAGAETGAVRPGTLLYAVVIVLAVTGALLALMAAKELLEQRRAARAAR
jgi:hypothetical protein